ncbi:MAG: phytanoyl-CoA dioxygenase family protein [Rhodobacteraceae bacterium]|nr:phytanoyl-CoA dioxygenase family protein [Paracoccaceae bacterium]
MPATLENHEQMAASFKNDGYLAIEPLYSESEMLALNGEIRRFIQDVVPRMPAERVYYEEKSDRSSLKQLQKMFEYDSYFKDLMLNGAVRRIAEIVLGEKVVPVNMQYFNKPAGIGKPTPPHQDGYYFHLKPCRAVTGWLALEDVDEENGCIHYVCGSHKVEGFRDHGQTGVLGFSQGMTDFGTQEDKRQSISLPGSAGTFLMHDAKTIHWAGANKSKTRSRRALGFIYYAESAKLDAEAKEAYQLGLDAKLRSTGAV